jgi:hypothetical protein
MVVTGDHSAMLNAYVEILRTGAGSRLIGLLPQQLDEIFEALRQLISPPPQPKRPVGFRLPDGDK